LLNFEVKLSVTSKLLAAAAATTTNNNKNNNNNNNTTNPAPSMTLPHNSHTAVPPQTVRPHLLTLTDTRSRVTSFKEQIYVILCIPTPPAHSNFLQTVVEEGFGILQG
jgi:hypothetical protein